MATRGKPFPQDQGAAPGIRRRRTSAERKRLQSDSLLKRIHGTRERIRTRTGELPESWPLLREDRDK